MHTEDIQKRTTRSFNTLPFAKSSGQDKGKSNTPTAKTVLLFDGVCALCHSSVNFIIDRDPKANVSFAPLQSDVGEALLTKYNIPSKLDTIVRSLKQKSKEQTNKSKTKVLIQDGNAYTHSTAMLRVLRLLKMPWPLLSVFLVLPRFLRDPFYKGVGAIRYNVFGKVDFCRVPTADSNRRFLKSQPPTTQEKQ